MDILKVLLNFIIFFPVIYASEDCQYSWCSDNNVLIRFPFQLEGEKNPYCGYPGFKLTCTNDSNTVLKLPYSKELYVRTINYLRQQIHLYDPSNCLPKRFLSLNLSGSPFIIASFRRNYTFLSCKTQNIGSQFIPLDCLSNSTNFVSAIPSVNFTNPLPESCHVMKELSFPVSMGGPYQENLRDELSEDLVLTWDTPDCRYCESQGDICGFDSRNSDQIRCFYDYYQTGRPRHGLRVFGIITLSIAGPAVICAIGMALYTCFKHRGTTVRIAAAQRSSPTATPTQLAIATTGLDESTIESYQKLVLGESRRLPGPNDGCCTICLSEYQSKDTIRCIPECSHCFHADCIDGWLRLNSTCPLCRNSPSPSPVHVMSTNL